MLSVGTSLTRGRYARSRMQLDLIHEQQQRIQPIGYKPSLPKSKKTDTIRRDLVQARENTERLQEKRDQQVQLVERQKKQLKESQHEFERLRRELEEILQKNTALERDIAFHEQENGALELARSQISASIASLKDEILSAKMNSNKQVQFSEQLPTSTAECLTKENTFLSIPQDLSSPLQTKPSETLTSTMIDTIPDHECGTQTSMTQRPLEEPNPVSEQEKNTEAPKDAESVKKPDESTDTVRQPENEATAQSLKDPEIVHISANVAGVFHIEAGGHYMIDICRRVLLDNGHLLRKAKVAVLKEFCDQFTQGQVTYRSPKDVTVDLLFEYANRVIKASTQAEQDMQISGSDALDDTEGPEGDIVN